MSVAFWSCAIITSISAIVSASFSLAAQRTSGGAQLNAMYASARSLSLAAVSLATLFTSSRSWLIAVATAMVIVQFLDALIGVKQRNVMKSAGPAFLAIVNLALLAWFI